MYEESPDRRASVLYVRDAARRMGVHLNQHDVEDLAQEALMRLIQPRRDGRTYDSIRPLKKIARNLLIDFLREERRRPATFEDLPDVPCHPEQQNEFLDFLSLHAPPAERKIITSVQRGVDLRDISFDTGIAAHNVHKHIHKIRKRLTKLVVASLDKALLTGDPFAKPEVLSLAMSPSHRRTIHAIIGQRLIGMYCDASSTPPKFAFGIGHSHLIRALDPAAPTDPILLTLTLLLLTFCARVYHSSVRRLNHDDDELLSEARAYSYIMAHYYGQFDEVILLLGVRTYCISPCPYDNRPYYPGEYDPPRPEWDKYFLEYLNDVDSMPYGRIVSLMQRLYDYMYVSDGISPTFLPEFRL